MTLRPSLSKVLPQEFAIRMVDIREITDAKDYKIS